MFKKSSKNKDSSSSRNQTPKGSPSGSPSPSFLAKPEIFKLLSFTFDLPAKGGLLITLQIAKAADFATGKSENIRCRLVGDGFWKCLSDVFGGGVISTFKLGFHPLYLFPDMLNPRSLKKGDKVANLEILLGQKFPRQSYLKRFEWIIKHSDPAFCMEFDHGEKTLGIWKSKHSLFNFTVTVKDMLASILSKDPPADIELSEIEARLRSEYPQESKKTEIKNEDSQKEKPKKVEPKKEESKKAEIKKEEPKKVEPKKVEPKKEEPRKEEPKKEEPKKEEPKKEEPKKEEPKKEEPSAQKEGPKKEFKPKKDQPFFGIKPKRSETHALDFGKRNVMRPSQTAILTEDEMKSNFLLIMKALPGAQFDESAFKDGSSLRAKARQENIKIDFNQRKRRQSLLNYEEEFLVEDLISAAKSLNFSDEIPIPENPQDFDLQSFLELLASPSSEKQNSNSEPEIENETPEEKNFNRTLSDPSNQHPSGQGVFSSSPIVVPKSIRSSTVPSQHPSKLSTQDSAVKSPNNNNNIFTRFKDIFRSNERPTVVQGFRKISEAFNDDDDDDQDPGLAWSELQKEQEVDLP